LNHASVKRAAHPSIGRFGAA